jgi:hypothetical protein
VADSSATLLASQEKLSDSLQSALKAGLPKFRRRKLCAEIYANLGQKDQAFAWLEKSYEEHEGSQVLLKVDPGLDRLRSDPPLY